jgi:tubulin polyglutamylase TTLL4
MEQTLRVPGQPLMAEFQKVMITTLIAGCGEIRKIHRHTSYELYGVDVMLDADCNVHLIQVNISRAMRGLDSRLGHDLKFRLNLDVLRMARIIECDPT